MADVGDDRGQLLLLAAVGLAIMFVTLALVMNTVIYTENLATRSSKVAGGSEATSYLAAVEDGIGGIVEYANYHNNTTHADLQSNLSDGVDEWSDAAGTLYAQSGAGTNISIQSINNGTRIEQDDASRNFTNTTGNATDWTLVTNVNETRKFRINITDETVLKSAGSGDEFEVNITDGSDHWRLNITHDTETNISVRNASGGEVTCTASNTEPWVNVTAGTVAGEECTGLNFAQGLTTPYSIEFRNADNVTGTYELIVTNASLAKNAGTNPHFSDDDSSGQPYVTPAIYSTRIDITYQSPRLYFNTSVRVVPGEDDG